MLFDRILFDSSCTQPNEWVSRGNVTLPSSKANFVGTHLTLIQMAWHTRENSGKADKEDSFHCECKLKVKFHRSIEARSWPSTFRTLKGPFARTLFRLPQVLAHGAFARRNEGTSLRNFAWVMNGQIAICLSLKFLPEWKGEQIKFHLEGMTSKLPNNRCLNVTSS